MSKAYMIAAIVLAAMLLPCAAHSSPENGAAATRHIMVGVKAQRLDESLIPRVVEVTVDGIHIDAEAMSGSGEYPLVLRIVAGPVELGSPTEYSVSPGKPSSMDLGGLVLSRIVGAVLGELQRNGVISGAYSIAVLMDYYVLQMDGETLTLTAASRPAGHVLNTVPTTTLVVYTATTIAGSSVSLETTTTSVQRTSATGTPGTASLPTSPARMPASPTAAGGAALSTPPTAPSGESTTTMSSLEKLVSVAVSAGIGLILAVLAYLLVRQLF